MCVFIILKCRVRQWFLNKFVTILKLHMQIKIKCTTQKLQPLSPSPQQRNIQTGAITDTSNKSIKEGKKLGKQPQDRRWHESLSEIPVRFSPIHMERTGGYQQVPSVSCPILLYPKQLHVKNQSSVGWDDSRMACRSICHVRCAG